ncbi:hypothetical protein HELRODRAFT_161173 [Helobdella robusta]|uniref:Immunoglobulin domain-containing protein n=1 Tax=Helobdella robusta TaxID=6412 RepID=T1ER67_HELRO|nr:hypothetical protein HELRODRAFT_161173 [Helobdella robusta]ESO01963.1 hypothetical protein HELRODRAFT_161173 [Helobdella robusta]
MLQHQKHQHHQQHLLQQNEQLEPSQQQNQQQQQKKLFAYEMNQLDGSRSAHLGPLFNNNHHYNKNNNLMYNGNYTNKPTDSSITTPLLTTPLNKHNIQNNNSHSINKSNIYDNSNSDYNNNHSNYNSNNNIHTNKHSINYNNNNHNLSNINSNLNHTDNNITTSNNTNNNNTTSNKGSNNQNVITGNFFKNSTNITSYGGIKPAAPRENERYQQQQNHHQQQHQQQHQQLLHQQQQQHRSTFNLHAFRYHPTNFNAKHLISHYNAYHYSYNNNNNINNNNNKNNNNDNTNSHNKADDYETSLSNETLLPSNNISSHFLVVNNTRRGTFNALKNNNNHNRNNIDNFKHYFNNNNKEIENRDNKEANSDNNQTAGNERNEIEMLTAARNYFVWPTDPIQLECTFRAHEYNPFHSPPIWVKGQEMDRTQVNMASSLRSPFLDHQDRMEVMFYKKENNDEENDGDDNDDDGENDDADGEDDDANDDSREKHADVGRKGVDGTDGDVFTFKLIISSCIEEDAGNYTCEIKSAGHDVRASVTHQVFIMVVFVIALDSEIKSYYWRMFRLESFLAFISHFGNLYVLKLKSDRKKVEAQPSKIIHQRAMRCECVNA